MDLNSLNSVMDQVPQFNNLGCDVSYEAAYEINNKVH
jgi:hypothetical protein